MTDTELEFGLFAVDSAKRTVRGIIVPWHEASRVSSTKNAPLTFRPGDIRVPRDARVVVLNRQHDRYDPIGNGARFDPSHARGLFAEYLIADTDEGDAWLADHGDLVRLSPELRDIVRHPDGTATATLTGSALVDEGAFASAGLFAIGDVVEVQSTIRDDVAPIPPAAPAAPIEGAQPSMTADTIVPPGSTAETPSTTIPKAPSALSARGLFAALAAKHNLGSGAALEAFANEEASTGLFAAYAALKDFTATNGVAAQPAAYVGEIAKRRTFVQRILPLFAHDNLTALKITGWQWTTPPEVGPWDGDKKAVPSNQPVMGPVEGLAERIAGAHDIDRAFRDFGNEGFWASYFRAMTESYYQQADAKVYAWMLAAATTVAPGTVPAGADKGTVALVDGALSVITNGYLPTFGVVATDIYRSMLLTPKDKVLEFLSQAVGLEAGQLAGFRLIPDARLAAGRVIVGAKDAGTVYELPGAPIRVEGLDVAHGGIDPALFGYVGWITNDAKALASVTVAA